MINPAVQADLRGPPAAVIDGLDTGMGMSCVLFSRRTACLIAHPSDRLRHLTCLSKALSVIKTPPWYLPTKRKRHVVHPLLSDTDGRNDKGTALTTNIIPHRKSLLWHQCDLQLNRDFFIEFNTELLHL